MNDHPTPDGTDTREELAFQTAFARVGANAQTQPLDPELVRRQARTRSRVKIGGTALAVLLVAGGIVGGTQLLGENESGTSPATTLPAPADGWRWEFYRDIRFQVPADWGYAVEPGSDWCVDNGSWLPDDPYVDLVAPGRATLDIGCAGYDPTTTGFSSQPPTHLWAPHVKVDVRDDSDVGTSTEDDWIIVKRAVGEAEVTVVSKDRGLAEQIASTAEQVEDDSGGCAPHSQIEATEFLSPSPPFDVTAIDDVDSITVCQYDLGDDSKPGLLAVSELTGQAADRQLAALQAAPVGGGPDRPENCTHDGPGNSAIELRLRAGDDVHSMYVYYSTCYGNGFDDGTNLRELTTDACQPLIRPPVAIWSGSSASFERCINPDR